MKIFIAENRFENKPLMGMTQAVGNYKEVDNEIYRWRLEGAEEKPLRVLENVESGNSKPGQGGEPFKIKLDEGWCKSPDVLMGEDNEYPLRIIGEPVADGDGYIYTVVLQLDDPRVFLPPALLEPGKTFVKSWTSTAIEFNEEFGTTQFGSNFMLQSQIGTFGQEFTLTDKAFRESGRLGVPLKVNGKKQEKFVPVAEMKMREELYMSMERQMMWGKRSWKQDVGTAYPVITGPGLREQLKDGHIERHSGNLTVNRLFEYLMDIFFARKSEGNRKITLMTGTMGALEFHNMLANEANNQFTVSQHYVKDLPSGSNHLAYGADFKRYEGPQGVTVDLVLNPLYDDMRASRTPHPDYPDKPLDSWRYTILDFGDSGGESNIQMLKLKGFQRYGYVKGSIGPNGPVRGGETSSAKAGCHYFVEDSAGIWIKDATRTGELILDFDE